MERTRLRVRGAPVTPGQSRQPASSDAKPYIATGSSTTATTIATLILCSSDAFSHVEACDLSTGR